jgi:hypothetical protein
MNSILTRDGITMTKSTFNLAAALETLRTTDRTALDKLILESASAGHVPAVAVLLDGGAHANARNTEDRTRCILPPCRVISRSLTG